MTATLRRASLRPGERARLALTILGGYDRFSGDSQEIEPLFPDPHVVNEAEEAYPS
jgi:hypothetical protein